MTGRVPKTHPKRTYGRGSRGQPKSYSDGPRQTYFQPRVSNVLHRQALTPTPATRQQTLTQIDFVNRTPFNHEDLELEYEAPEVTRPRKKRRLAVESSENARSPNVQTRASHRRSFKCAEAEAKEKGPAQVSGEAPSRSHHPESRNGDPLDTAVLAQAPPRTPSRREIPSSQSPEEPLSSVHSRTSVKPAHDSPLKDVTNRKRNTIDPMTERSGLSNMKPRPIIRAADKPEAQAHLKTSEPVAPQRARRFASTDKENVNPFHSRRAQRLQDGAWDGEVENPTASIVSIFVPDSEDAVAGMVASDAGLRSPAEIVHEGQFPVNWLEENANQ